MLPRGVGHQIATPTVSQLVCNDIDIFTVLRDDTGGRKGKDRVLHAAIREAGRQNQNVILAPNIGGHDFLHLQVNILSICHKWGSEYLDGVNEGLRVGLQFPLALLQLVRAGSYHTSRTD